MLHFLHFIFVTFPAKIYNLPSEKPRPNVPKSVSKVRLESIFLREHFENQSGKRILGKKLKIEDIKIFGEGLRGGDFSKILGNLGLAYK